MRDFSLAGLLRLRKLEEDIAASELASANRKVHDNQALQSRVRRNIAGMESTAATSAQLRAIAAARSATNSTLTELDGVLHRLHDDAHKAQDAHTAARARSRGIEKLRDKHTAAEVHEDLRAEQNALDEIRRKTNAVHRGNLENR